MIDFSNKVEVKRITPANVISFFGYYDISPENESGTKVLYNSASFGNRMPQKEDELQVGFVISDTDTYIEIGKTKSWNFQEGCRLQWISDIECIYNIRTSDGYGSVIYDTAERKIIKQLDFPVYSICGSKCVTYNFNRSRYSYAHDEKDEEIDYKNDGVFLCDLADGSKALIISLERLATDSNAIDYVNWVEHCSFNPEGTKFCFFHRWTDKFGGMHTRFCVSDLEGNYKVLLNEGFCSHFGWKNNEIITAWGRMPSKINSIQKNSFLRNSGIYKIMVKVYHSVVRNDSMRQKITNDTYIYFDTNTLEKNKLNNLDFTSDGHCTWSNNERYMLTDTYPDTVNKRHLMLLDTIKDTVIELGKFDSFPDIRDPEAYKLAGVRCDLHPKWSKNNQYIYFDSTHEGYRALYRVNVSCLLGNIE